MKSGAPKDNDSSYSTRIACDGSYRALIGPTTRSLDGPLCGLILSVFGICIVYGWGCSWGSVAGVSSEASCLEG